MLTNDQEWALHHGDCIPHLATMPEACVDFSCFSPPFPQTFAYTSLAEDLGNSEEYPEMKLHFGFFYKAMLRVMKPGRVMVVHVAQIHKRKRDGEEGCHDFRGLNIRLAQRAGFTFDYDWCIRVNPQAQAIRTRKWELKFQGLESDRAISRGAMPYYLIKFRAPGTNAVPIDSEGDVSRNDWIEWAEPCWDNINEQDTLNYKKARGPNDTRHICPLQKQIIDRLVRLYSNPGELVYSPFTGVGSEGVMALKRGRRFYGCEIKDEYVAAAKENLARAVREREAESKTLFDALEAHHA